MSDSPPDPSTDASSPSNIENEKDGGYVLLVESDSLSNTDNGYVADVSDNSGHDNSGNNSHVDYEAVDIHDSTHCVDPGYEKTIASVYHGESGVPFDNRKKTIGVEYETVVYNQGIHGFNPSIKKNLHEYTVKVEPRPKRVGVMIVGLSGNNGATLTASLLAHKHGIEWETRDGKCSPNYFGSITQSSSTSIGEDIHGNSVYCSLKKLFPMIDPNDIVVGGWDIRDLTWENALRNSRVFEPTFVNAILPHMEEVEVLPGIHYEGYIATNQDNWADNINVGLNKVIDVSRIIEDISKFRRDNELERVIVIWSGSTERNIGTVEGKTDTEQNFEDSLFSNDPAISPSMVYCYAAVEAGCTFVNASPQHTYCQGIIDFASRKNILLLGNDMKSGQTKYKSVMADFLIGAGIQINAVSSYNHLGNNDGKNLSEAEQFKSKELSKSNLLGHFTSTNNILYKNEDDTPDHNVVIKYVPAVGDSKRAMDEYYSTIFMNGKSVISTFNICEDSLLAVPLIIDIIVLEELMSRVRVGKIELMDVDATHGGYTETIRCRPKTLNNLFAYFFKEPNDTDYNPRLMEQKRYIEEFLKMLAGVGKNGDFPIHKFYEKIV
jgi:myo-inositol-1-phosphate synthase